MIPEIEIPESALRQLLDGDDADEVTLRDSDTEQEVKIVKR